MKNARDIVLAVAEFSRASHLNLFPLINVSRGYTRAKLQGDLRAGLNVALLAFPQGMAYAAIAGLPIEYGIFGSAVAAILGPILSGSRYVILGPTNATAVLLFASFLSIGVNEQQALMLLPLLLLLTGLFLILGAFLKVANLIQFVSRSVITGYITAAALYIIVNQARKVMGFDFEIPAGSTFMSVLWLTIKNAPHSHLPTLILSGSTALTYLILRRRFPAMPNVAITLVLASVLGHALNLATLRSGFLQDYGQIEQLRAVTMEEWSITVPPLNLEWAGLLAQVALVIAFLSTLEASSIGKSLAARAGERLNTSQEMMGLGLANLGCAFLNGMPASGSLTRSQLNWNSGGVTAYSSMFSGFLIIVAALSFGRLIQYIPTSALGVLVIAIGLSLINRHSLRVVLKSTRSDAIVFLTTFVAALLLRLDFAIILGATTSIVLFLKKASVPELVEYGADASGQLAPKAEGAPRQTVAIVHVEGELFFGATEIFRDQMRRTCEDPDLKIVILKMRNAHHLDATSILALEELINYMRDTGRVLLISEAREDAMRIIRRSGLLEVLGEDNIFPDNLENPTMPTALALRRAKKLLAGQDAGVSIFVGTQKTGRKADD